MSLIEIRKSLEVMVLPGDIVELRIFDQFGKKFCGWFNDIEKMAEAALSHDGTAEGTYYTCNACVPGMLAIANNRIIPCTQASTENNIERRRILGLDIDPVRNPVKISSTDSEKLLAYNRAIEVRAWLSGQGFSLPVLGDSGNGYHLDYFVDLPNTPDIKKIYEAVYKVIQIQFPKDTVDVQGFADANRIWKVYGTMARKGENMPDRPHRQSKLLEIPEKRELVSLELLQKIADIDPIDEQKMKKYCGACSHRSSLKNCDVTHKRVHFEDTCQDFHPRVFKEHVTENNTNGKAWNSEKLEAWLKEHGAVIERTKKDGDITRFVLKACLMNPEHEGHKEAEVHISSAGIIGYKCHHNSCSNVSWVMIREKLEPGYKEKKNKSMASRTAPGEDDDGHIYTDMRNSEKLAALVKDTARYCYKFKAWMVYNGKIWEEDNCGYMMRKARDISHQLQIDAINIEDFDKRKIALRHALECESGARLRAMIELCQSEEGMMIDENDFDKNKMYFNVQNGTIDLNTGKLLPFNPSDYMTRISPITYDPKATCPRFMTYLDEVINYDGSDEDEKNFRTHQLNIISYLKKWGGYSLTGVCREEQFLILYGDGGTGKSKFIGAIGYVHGNYFDKISMDTLQETHKAKDGSACTPDLVSMKGMRLIAASEPEKGLKLNEARIKDFTGRDAIKCRGLHQKPITYMPDFKLVLYTNYQIIIRGQDNSIWRRVHQVGFRKPEMIDLNLDLKLRDESAGIFNWMLGGCLEWNKTGLNVPSEIIEAVEEYKDEMDLLSGYFETCCICNKKDHDLKELGKDLFHVYKAWWRIEHDYDAPMFDKQFYQSLHERGYKKSKKYSRNGTFIYHVKMMPEVRDALENAESLCGGYNSEAVKLVTQFLGNFLLPARGGKFTGKCFTSFTASQNKEPDNEHKNESPMRAAETSQKDIMVDTHNMLLKDVGFKCVELSDEGQIFYADNLKTKWNIPQDRALEYVKKAISNIAHGG